MNNYTIRELDSWVRQAPGRDCLKWGDWTQLENKLQNQLSAAATPRLRTALQITQTLKRLFRPGQPVPKKLLAQKIDEELRSRNLTFTVKTHAPAHSNTFFSPDAGMQFCDVAFYHPDIGGEETEGHHDNIHLSFKDNLIPELRTRLPRLVAASAEPTGAEARALMIDFLAATQEVSELESLFYMRVEHGDNKILIGNMQIDTPPGETAWKNTEVWELIYARQNIYAIMVQHAIKRLLKAPSETKLYFQAGQAAEVAQWGDRSEVQRRELITKENLPRYEKLYRQQLVRLGEITVGSPGKYMRGPSKTFSRGIVIRKTPTAAQTALLAGGYMLIYVFDAVPLIYGYRAEFTEQTVRPDFIKNFKSNIEPAARQGVDEQSNELEVEKNGYYLNISDLTPTMYTLRRMIRERPKLAMVLQAHRSLYLDLKIAYNERNAEKMLATVDRIFEYVVALPPAGPTRARKIAALERLFDTGAPAQYCGTETPEEIEPSDDPEAQPGERGHAQGACKLYAWLQPFLEEFNYHELLLQQLPGTRALKMTAGGIYLLNENERRTTDINIVEPPVLNEMAPKGLAEPPPEHQNSTRWMVESKLYKLYENRLPKIFKKLNLKFKKTVFTTMREGEVLHAPVWEICTPRSELAARAFRCF